MDDTATVDIVVAAVRIIAGVWMFLHGYNKLFRGGRIPGTARWFESIGMKPGTVHAYTAAITEVTSGLGLAAGLFTPLCAAAFAGLMLVASWTHKGKFFVFNDGWEYNVVLAASAALVATIGPGRWSLDRLLGIDDDFDGTIGILVTLGGAVLAIGLLLVAWEDPKKSAGAVDAGSDTTSS